MKKILVTGGAGYIGSHTVVELQEQGYEPVIIDNFCNSSAAVLDRLERITGARPQLLEGDLRDARFLDALFSNNEFQAVIHFAGLKAVGESFVEPLSYYDNNVTGALNLFAAMQRYGCQKLVFSSSATVYGAPRSVPIKETAPLSATSPYGQTKLMVEHILRDLCSADENWRVSILRYFNPIAAHPSGLIGEDPNGVPNNLMPYVGQVAVGKLKQLSVFGGDYPTHDGTGVRDYIHVVDLADAHIKALAAIDQSFGCQVYNIGTGRGYSVLEMISAFERASGVKIPYKIVGRRDGDVDECFADPLKSGTQLSWRAERDLNGMMEDQWRWQNANPNGYRSEPGEEPSVQT